MSFIRSAIVRVINNTRVTIQCRIIKRLHSNPPPLKLSSYGHQQTTQAQQNQNQRKRYVGHIEANYVLINYFSASRWNPSTFLRT